MANDRSFKNTYYEGNSTKGLPLGQGPPYPLPMKRFLVFVLIASILSSAALVLASAPPAGTLPAGGLPGALQAVAALPAQSAITAMALGLALACFLFGAATGDYSWVDRIWSIAPVAFAWVYASAARWASSSLLAALVVSAWGLRLSLNFARRGGYSGTEDYRWAILRERIRNPLAWQAFNAAFICLFQIAVLVLIAAPLGRLAEAQLVGPSWGFLAALGLGLAFLVWETVADGQQWRFQEAKAAWKAGLEKGEKGADPDGDLARGFRTTGLFGLCRHPNYLGELGFWWSIYLAGCAAGPALHWSLAGGLALTAVFVGSTRFTESLSAAKYPAYRDYQASTPAILPFPRRPQPAPAAGR
jgi:steroid 5-alpha reductase family enzyme